MQTQRRRFTCVALLVAACTHDVAGTPFGAGSAAAGDTGGPDNGEDPSAGDGGATEDAGATDGGNADADDGNGSSSGGHGDDGASSDGGDATGSDGSTGDPAAEGSSGAADGGVGVWDYGPCSGNPPCPAEQCMTIGGFDGSFCTTPCIEGMCPAPPDGDAVAQCLLGPDLEQPPVNCVLTCSVSEQSCPGGMTCVDAMMGGDAGVCLWQG